MLNKSIYIFENLLDDGVFVWVLGGGLFSGIWPAAVIWWVSGSVIVNLTKGDRFLEVSPFVVPKNKIFLLLWYLKNSKSIIWVFDDTQICF